MRLSRLVLPLACALALAPEAAAHCDTLDGPVVKAAQGALDTGNVNLVLIWVQKDGEKEIREAFDRTVAVRKLGGEARKLADQFFFETVVRVHRAGEGAPYTGLKPAGLDMGPAIRLGDQAMETGDLKPVWKLLNEKAHTTLHQKFEAAYTARTPKAGDVEAGRRAVAAYITYIHYADGLYRAASGQGPAEGEAGHGTSEKGGCGHD